METPENLSPDEWKAWVKTQPKLVVPPEHADALSFMTELDGLAADDPRIAAFAAALEASEIVHPEGEEPQDEQEHADEAKKLNETAKIKAKLDALLGKKKPK